jgi:hypothetical protein
MEDYIYENVKIDTKAPSFEVDFYDPNNDSDGKISSEELA